MWPPAVPLVPVADPCTVAVPSAHLRWVRAWSAAPRQATTHAGRAAIGQRRKDSGWPMPFGSTATPPRSGTARSMVEREMNVPTRTLRPGRPYPLKRQPNRQPRGAGSVAGGRDQGRFRRVLGLLRRPLLLQALAGLLHGVPLRRLVGHDGPSHDIGVRSRSDDGVA